MSPHRVSFTEQGDRIEIVDFDPEATIGDLVRDLEAYRLAGRLCTSRCAGCGECCNQPIPVLSQDRDSLASAELLRVDYPSPPDPRMYAEAVATLMRDADLDDDDARSIYEYNNSRPVILERESDGTCVFLDDGYCSIYERRPLACRIYLCRMGERLEILQERIVSSGTWHLYADLGWIDRTELSHNPFFGIREHTDVRLAAFGGPSVDSMEKLFFYF